MCFGSVGDQNSAWAEYEGLRTTVAAQGLSIERCKPKTKATPASDAPSTCTMQPNTPELLWRLSAAAELVPSTDGASTQALMTKDMMHDIADLIYKRFLKGKAPPQE
jgi:hypothetical protein